MPAGAVTLTLTKSDVFERKKKTLGRLRMVRANITFVCVMVKDLLLLTALRIPPTR